MAAATTTTVVVITGVSVLSSFTRAVIDVYSYLVFSFAARVATFVVCLLRLLLRLFLLLLLLLLSYCDRRPPFRYRSCCC